MHVKVCGQDRPHPQGHGWLAVCLLLAAAPSVVPLCPPLWYPCAPSVVPLCPPCGTLIPVLLVLVAHLMEQGPAAL